MTYKVERRQGSLVVRGDEYQIFQCDLCSHMVPREELGTCHMCKRGEMQYIGKIVMRPNALPDHLALGETYGS